jgi:hypothetical protein
MGASPGNDLTQQLARAAQADATRFEELCARVAPALVAWAELRLGAKLRGSVDPMDAALGEPLRILMPIKCRFARGCSASRRM